MRKLHYLHDHVLPSDGGGGAVIVAPVENAVISSEVANASAWFRGEG